ncbi:molecular chaperone Hsp60, partial [Clostridium felsineum]|nr:molecular chaperone Hsp60 [Clostridium felsineum]
MRIIRRKEDFSKVKDSKDTISNMEKVIGHFGLGAMVSISNNLALNIPNLTGLYNDKRLRY